MYPLLDTPVVENDIYAALAGNNYYYARHFHAPMELFFVYSGKYEITVRNHTRVMEKDSLTIIFPNEIHGYQSVTEDAKALVIIVELPLTGVHSDTLLNLHPTFPFLTQDLLHPQVPYLLEELWLEYQLPEKETLEAHIYAPLVQLLLARILPKLSLEHNKSSDYEGLTYQIAACMQENFRESFSLQQLATKIGISKYQLSRVFSEKMGQSFPTYLNSLRVTYACKLLKDTSLSVTDIAVESGFESQSSFFRIFKIHCGVSPLQYREHF